MANSPTTGIWNPANFISGANKKYYRKNASSTGTAGDRWLKYINRKIPDQAARNDFFSMVNEILPKIKSGSDPKAIKYLLRSVEAKFKAAYPEVGHFDISGSMLDSSMAKVLIRLAQEGKLGMPKANAANAANAANVQATSQEIQANPLLSTTYKPPKTEEAAKEITRGSNAFNATRAKINENFKKAEAQQNAMNASRYINIPTNKLKGMACRLAYTSGIDSIDPALKQELLRRGYTIQGGQLPQLQPVGLTAPAAPAAPVDAARQYQLAGSSARASLARAVNAPTNVDYSDAANMDKYE